jgi:hypothetical protein
MKAHQIFPAVALAMLWGGHAFASGPAYSYVTTGPGKQVLKVENSTGNVTSIYASNAQGVTRLSDVTLFADGNLYVGAINGANPSSSNILKLGSNDLFAADNPKELRFSAYGTLFCNGGAGVRRVVTVGAGCIESVVTAANAAGTGLAFSANGSLIASIGGSLLKIPVDKTGKGIGSPTTIATALSGVVSIGVAAGGANTATGFTPDDIIVASAAKITKYVRDKGQASGYQAAVDVVTAPDGRTINYMELDAEDRIWFTTMIVDGGSNDVNGELWVYANGSASRVATAPKQNGKYWPMVGLALDPSDRAITISAAQPKADFGSSWFEISGSFNPDCTLTVRATTKFEDLPTFAESYKLNPYLGDEGFSTVYDAHVSNGCDPIFKNDDGRVIISARQSSETNPRILKCEPIDTCAPVLLLAVFHTGPLDDDGGDEGGTDSFSRWLVVNENLPSSGYMYCGIQTPLKDGGDADHPRSSVNTGSNLTVKFQIGRSDCKQNHVVSDPNAQFLISVARVGPDYEAKHIPDSSGNSNQPPLFRFSVSGSQFIYNLSLKNLDGTNFEPGTYEITITDVNSPPYITGPPPIYFSVTPK